MRTIPRRQPALLLSHAHRHHIFDIALNLTAPNGLLFMLNVPPERQHEVVCGDAFTVQPGLPITEYREVIGNRCARIAVPAGVQQMRVSNHATVRDSGPGIAEDELPQVLQPFHRLEASRNRSTSLPGTGAGAKLPTAATDFTGPGGGERQVMAGTTWSRPHPLG